jgi:hypothetical protein
MNKKYITFRFGAIALVLTIVALGFFLYVSKESDNKTVGRDTSALRPDALIPAAVETALVEGPNSLAIWVGTYYDQPQPNIKDAVSLVQWDSPFKLLDMKESPDHRYLALILSDTTVEGEGDVPSWIYTIDLVNKTAQSIPDYSHEAIYRDKYFTTVERIVGWLDNDRLVVQETFTGNDRVRVATKDGASYTEVGDLTQYSSVHDTALAPDRATFFSDTSSGFWRYGVDGSNPLNILSEDNARAAFYPTWSPDGAHISFASPKVETVNGEITTDYLHAGVWLLNMTTFAQTLISGEDDWNAGPSWSQDGSKVAFLRADAPVTNSDDVWYNRTAQVNTNIFVVDLADLEPKQTTSFEGTKNSDMQWTQSGNIVFSSTAWDGNLSATLGMLAVSAINGSTTTLFSPGTNEAVAHPIIFK